MNRDIKSLTLDELQAELQAWNQPAYRARQVLEWLYAHRVTAWEQMTSLPKALRERLQQNFTLGALELIVARGTPDSTWKFLWRLPDHALIESVLIPANPALYGETSDRFTLCVSTQVGCAYGCRFCASGLAGWKRNLGAEEIVDQVLAVERWQSSPPRELRGGLPSPTNAEPGTPGAAGLTEQPGARPSSGAAILQPGTILTNSPRVRPFLRAAPEDGRTPQPAADRLVNNLVIMGMGEPLANYDHLLQALRILNASWGAGIGARKITISTSGLVPQIRRLAEEPYQFRLAVSLHGTTDGIRSRLMPVNRKYPLRELVWACEYYLARKGRMITLEYILIAGVNDSLEQARLLADFARRLQAKVNLIPYNHVAGLAWSRPSEPAQEAFREIVADRGVAVTLRREKGHEIDAACGQLRLKAEQELAGSASSPAGNELAALRVAASFTRKPGSRSLDLEREPR